MLFGKVLLELLVVTTNKNIKLLPYWKILKIFLVTCSHFQQNFRDLVLVNFLIAISIVIVFIAVVVWLSWGLWMCVVWPLMNGLFTFRFGFAAFLLFRCLLFFRNLLLLLWPFRRLLLLLLLAFPILFVLLFLGLFAEVKTNPWQIAHEPVSVIDFFFVDRSFWGIQLQEVTFQRAECPFILSHQYLDEVYVRLLDLFLKLFVLYRKCAQTINICKIFDEKVLNRCAALCGKLKDEE